MHKLSWIRISLCMKKEHDVETKMTVDSPVPSHEQRAENIVESAKDHTEPWSFDRKREKRISKDSTLDVSILFNRKVAERASLRMLSLTT